MSIDTTVKGLLTTHSSLSGLFTTFDNAALADGDRCLVVAQNDTKHNGIYIARSGTWERDPDAHYTPAMGVRIYGGSYYRHSEWILDSEADVEPDVNPQVWTLNSLKASAVPSDTFARDNQGRMKLLETGVQPGVYEEPTLQIGSDGRVIRATSGGGIRSYIEGLQPEYLVSSTSIYINSGAAYVPGLNKVVSVPTAFYAVPPAQVNTKFYIYLTEVNGAGAVHFSTTIPASPYFATASTMTGNESMRYIGSVVTGPLLDGMGRAVIAASGVEAYSDAYLDRRNYAPVGAITMWTTQAFVPTFWVECDGGYYDIDFFTSLYEIVGTTWGAIGGGGPSPPTHFAVPDLRGRVPLGAGTGIANDAFSDLDSGGAPLVARYLGDYVGSELSELRTHQHSMARDGNFAGGGSKIGATSTGGGAGTTANETLGNSGWGNMQPATAVRFIIRYA